MKERTLVIIHSFAPSAARHSVNHNIWGLMKESTLGINHSAAPSVSTSAQHRVVWKNMKESTLVIRSTMSQNTEIYQTRVIRKLLSTRNKNNQINNSTDYYTLNLQILVTCNLNVKRTDLKPALIHPVRLGVGRSLNGWPGGPKGSTRALMGVYVLHEVILEAHPVNRLQCINIPDNCFK